MTTADNALFSRVIFLSFSQTKFSDEAKVNFDNFKKLEQKGLTHITALFLAFRPIILENYALQYNLTMEDIKQKLDSRAIEDRIMKNWVVLLSAFRCIKMLISLPFTYEKAVDVFAGLIVRQNSEVLAGNEVSDFWNIFQELFSGGMIENKYDLLIKEVQELKCLQQHYTRRMIVLFINPNRIFSLYAQAKKNNQDKKLPKDTLQYYLQNSDDFLGLHQMRFKKTTKNLQDRSSATHLPGDGSVFHEYERPNAWCFDYEKLVERIGLNLETEFFNSEENFEK
jgi:hypothetical protein